MKTVSKELHGIQQGDCDLLHESYVWDTLPALISFKSSDMPGSASIQC